MKNILIITYAWPPAAGIGAQRWFKLSKYLLRQKINPIILSVDEHYAAHSMGIDNSLMKEIPKELIVYKTKTFEPLKVILLKFRAKRGSSGGIGSPETKRGFLKLIQSIRSHLFIPDPRTGWNRYAIKKANQILNDHNIKIVITSSPPHSSQLIGLKLKEKFDIKWIADFRDSWTDSRFFNSVGHSYFSKSRNKTLEKEVLLKADKILTVGDSLKLSLLKKSNNLSHSKITVIHNGYDKDDFEKQLNTNPKVFNICYCGNMAENYEPYVFFKALKEVKNNITNVEINIYLVGFISKGVKEELLKTGLNIRFITSVSHREAIKYQQKASLLLLVIPNTIDANMIITGKLFEYLATRNRIICIGPKSGDAAKIINECNCGKTFERTDIQKIQNYIRISVNDFINNKKIEPNEEEIERYSREFQAKVLQDEFEILLSE